jgi:uncharacterized protein with PIN domain
VTHRLYLDENVIPDLAVMLRACGYDAISCHEMGALGASDDAQLELAAFEQRTVLTYNYRDFSRIAEEWALAGDRTEASSFRTVSIRD